MPTNPRDIAASIRFSASRIAHRGERFRRAILGGVISRLSFESDPELVALPDLGETVDRPEAHRAEVVRRSFRRLFDVAAGTLAGNDEAHGAQVRKRLSHHGARDAKPIGENDFRGQSSRIVEFPAADQLGDPGRQIGPPDALVVRASANSRCRAQERLPRD
jgi:hypothetical protein